ncbi:MAG: restriction endonuclease subunit S [Nitrospira sp.]
MPLKAVAQKITDGEHLNPRFVLSGIPIVMAEQVEDSGVNLVSCKKVSEDDFAKFTKKCAPRWHDVLIVSRGATIGRTCVVNTDKQFCLMGSVILLKVNPEVIYPHFLSSQLKSAHYSATLKTTSGSSAQQAIYISHLEEKTVIVPPTLI